MSMNLTAEVNAMSKEEYFSLARDLEAWLVEHNLVDFHNYNILHDGLLDFLGQSSGDESFGFIEGGQFVMQAVYQVKNIMPAYRGSLGSMAAAFARSEGAQWASPEESKPRRLDVNLDSGDFPPEIQLRIDLVRAKISSSSPPK